MFGQSTSGSAFGQPTAFGASSTTPFGTMNSQPQQNSLFGQTSTPSLFGMSNQSNSIFGSTTAQPTTFGSQPNSTFGTGTSLFGNTSQQQSTSLFGNNNRFGITTGSTFGANTLGQPINVPTGTTVKFVPQTGTDTMMKNGQTHSTSISIRLQCISCMREYDTKSLEELRAEDYQANRKGPQQSGGLFGNSTLNTGGSLFSNTAATNTFGASSSGSLFTQNKPTFGSIAPATTTTSFFATNLANTNQVKPNFFSANTNTAAGFQPQTQQTSLFGNTNTSQPAIGSSLFGPTNLSTNPTTMFGAQTSQASSLFGTPASQSLTATKSVFGSTTAPFGSQPQTSNALFGNTTNTSNLFGATSQASLFNPNSTANTGLGGNKSLFSFSTPSQGLQMNNTASGLGTATSTTNLFGTTSNTFGNAGGSNLFGSSSNAFSFPSSQPFQSTNPSLQFNPTPFASGANTGFATNSLMNAAQTNMANSSSPVNTEQILTRLQALPYGSSPQLLNDSSLSLSSAKTKFTTDPKTLNQYKLNAKSQTEVKVQRVPASGKPTTLLFDGLDDESSVNLKCAQDILQPRPNIKKLVLNKSSTPLNKSSLGESNLIKSPISNESELFNKENRSPESTNTSFSKQMLENTIDVMNKLSDECKDLNGSVEKSFSFDSLNTSTGGDKSILTNNATNVATSAVVPKCGIVLTRTDYYTIPSIEECDTFYDPENDSCMVDSFTVGRIGYGSIYWKGPLNVKGINLDEIVHIRRKEVIVYPDDDIKPPVGEGLNRPAQVTLDKVWPIDKNTREFIKDPERLHAMKYSEKVESATIKLDAVFKEYRPDTGSWVFTVKHFSKYGLDADDEVIDVEPNTQKAAQMEKRQMKQKPTEVNGGIKLNGDAAHGFTNGHSDRKDISIAAQVDSKENAIYGLSTNIESSGRDSAPSNVSSLYNYQVLFNDNDMEDMSSIALTSKANNELNLMRSALFLDQNEQEEAITKKCKNSLTRSVTSHQVIPSLFPSKFKSTLTKRRNLVFEPSTYQHKASIYSFGYSPAPKVHFINGSNKFCIIQGSQVMILEVDLLQLNTDDRLEKLEQHLISSSSVEVPDNCLFPPFIQSTKFHLFLNKNSNLNELIDALYGDLTERSNYSRYQERMRYIKRWLFNFNKSLNVPESAYARIMHFLTTNELEFAVTECLNSKQPRLACLIANGPHCNKSALLSQLTHWKQSESDAHIDIELLKLYILFSGQCSWVLSTGQSVNVLEDLQWTQQLVLSLLYKSNQLSDSEYVRTNTLKTAFQDVTAAPTDAMNQVAYHLLAQNSVWVALAACDKDNSLNAWFLHESLLSFNAIAKDKNDSINLYIASQIADLRWALFFALHIRNEFLRFHFVKELLIRNAIQLIDPVVETFVKDRLAINNLLIAEAKLYYWKSCFHYKNAAFSLLECGQFSEAHDIFVEKIFPELVINEDYEEIRELIERLRPHQQAITNWCLNGAGIYDTFIQLLRFKNNVDLDQYQQLIEQFNIDQLHCPTKRHYLCQSQMSRVANIIHAELNGGMYPYHTPIPDDYTLLELRSNAFKIFETHISV